jgi:hypothetical protein
LPLVWFFLWALLWIVSLIWYLEEHPNVGRLRLVISGAAAILLGALLLRIWRCFRGDLEGTVLAVRERHSYSLFRNESGRRERDFHVRMTLTVDTGRVRRGKPVTRRMDFPIRNGFYLYYREGDRVCLWRGLPYPESTGREADPGSRVCVWCGEYTAQTEQQACAVCGAALPDRYGACYAASQRKPKGRNRT